MTKGQVKLLEQRVQEAYGNKRREIYSRKKPAKPSSVVRAEQVIAAYEKDTREASDALWGRLETARKIAREAILFQSADNALVAVKLFESFKP